MERAKKSSSKFSNVQRNVDRLSALPDFVICHILSFLPTKLSMATSILAKRYRFLWAHVPDLDFICEYRSNIMRFLGIVNSAMLRHKVQRLNYFRLTITGDVDTPCYELETCIATVVERNIQNLILALSFQVPRCLLTCKTLVDLTMYSVSIPPCGPISLPNLKKLDLRCLKCEVDFTRLLSGCPVLEELSIRGTTCSDPRGCYISSPTLKSLTISYLADSSIYNNPDYMVTINTPALRYLKVNDCSCKHISILPCTSLVEAHILLDTLCEPDDFCHHYMLTFLESIRNVRCLTFTGLCDKICGGPMPGSIVKFENLTELELTAPWCLLTKFLVTADHLQILTISEYDLHSEHWRDPVEERCACLLRSLRTVRIDVFRCKEQGFNMIRYILRNAQVLERMEINFSYVVREGKFDALRRISIFPRESKKCELHFS